jgi:hypothetical protein
MQITYAGGPIVACPQVYLSFWGPAWADSAHQQLASNLQQFHQDLIHSNFMNVLTQYGIAGVGGGAVIQSSFITWAPSTLTVASYTALIQSCIDAGAIPDPSSPTQQVFIVYLDENTEINDPNNHILTKPAANHYAGYHDHFTTRSGGPFYYAFLANSGEALSIEEALLTEGASHEFAEMITDPAYTAWTPDHGAHEICDQCDSQADTVTVGPNTWTIQKVWSDNDKKCVGQSPTPTAVIHPGPRAVRWWAEGADQGVVTQGRPRIEPSRIASHERVLPLPPIWLQEEPVTIVMHGKDMAHYLSKAFFPLRPERLVRDLPGLLRRFAEVAEKKKQDNPDVT